VTRAGRVRGEWPPRTSIFGMNVAKSIIGHGLQFSARRPRPALPAAPDLRDWLPEGHLAWFILDVTDQLDLEPFYRQHRNDGHGHPAYDPKLLLGVLLGVLLYGYCLGVRSSRQIERRCSEDLAFRVLAGNQTPDHVTIARFRVRHEQALAGFLVESLLRPRTPVPTITTMVVIQLPEQRVHRAGVLEPPSVQADRGDPGRRRADDTKAFELPGVSGDPQGPRSCRCRPCRPPPRRPAHPA
jgi:transposase